MTNKEYHKCAACGSPYGIMRYHASEDMADRVIGSSTPRRKYFSIGYYCNDCWCGDMPDDEDEEAEEQADLTDRMDYADEIEYLSNHLDDTED